MTIGSMVNRKKPRKEYSMDSFEKLRDEWIEARKYPVFCDDGILDNEKWKVSSKIMFLLKETYNHWVEIRGSGEQVPQGGTSPTFWRRMRIWTYIIDETINGNEPDFNKAFSCVCIFRF
jgi:hypothetical protein